MTTQELAELTNYEAWQFVRPWLRTTLARLSRNLGAAAATGHELPDETLKDCRDFLGVLIGR